MKALPVLAILAATPLLSGCVGLFGGDPVVPENKTIVDNGTPLLKPDERSGGFSAFNETNLTDNLGHHNHDYWQGRARAPIFAGRAEMGFGPDGYEAVFRPPTGPEHLVYEGTASIEIVIKNPQRHVCEPVLSWNGALICTDHHQTSTPGGVPGTPVSDPVPVTDPQPLPNGPLVADPAPPASLTLQFLHAASGPGEWVDAGEVTWNTPGLIQVTKPTWTDMPHSSGSLWSFRILSTDDTASTLVFDIEATAVRATGEIPQWPGHPIFYTPEKHYRVIYDGPGKTESGGQLGATSAEFAEPGKLISAGTKALIVSVNVSSIDGQVPGQPPSNVYLYYHNASYTTWNLTDPFDPQYASDKGSYVWILRVDPNGMDSPYASASRWEFMLRAAFTPPVGPSCFDGCYGYRIEYKLTIVATDLLPAAFSQSRNAGA